MTVSVRQAKWNWFKIIMVAICDVSGAILAAQPDRPCRFWAPWAARLSAASAHWPARWPEFQVSNDGAGSMKPASRGKAVPPMGIMPKREDRLDSWHEP